MLMRQTRKSHTAQMKGPPMPRRVSQFPAESELEILSILWREGPRTVRQVHERLQNDGRDTSLTTTLKTMQIMVNKGFLTCGEERPRLYTATMPAEETQSGLLKNLVQKAFGGSVHKLLVRAVQDSGLSKDELKEIRRLIDASKGGSK
jgi:BlaI family transcriptional regulator, penicillinase repressor